MPLQKWTSEQSLNDWHHMFKSIYGNRNSERDEFKLFAHMAEVAGGFSKIVRKSSNPAEVTFFLGKSLAWFSALATKLGFGDLETVVWRKYPGICPYCGENRCTCKYDRPIHVLDNATLRRFELANRMARPVDLRGWQDLFSRIYGIPNRILGNTDRTDVSTRSQLLVAMNRLYEEMGELAESIRLQHITPIAVSSELADVFAWIMAVANLLPEHLNDSEFDLQSALWLQYPGKCNYCFASQCICLNDRVRESLIASIGAEGPQPIDLLTKLPRRDAFEKELTEAVATATDDVPLSLIVLDLDHFKAVNEKWKHSGGDKVLSVVAQIINRVAVSHASKAYRWGGEEFTIILAGYDGPSALVFAHELLEEIRGTVIEMSTGEKHHQTVSAGVATFRGVAGKSLPVATREFFDAADNAVFLAKNEGRDRVVMAKALET
jgi:diguanylate cyclase (GGDEF)-like protein